MHPWLESWGVEAEVSDLTVPAAVGFVRYLRRSGDGIAVLAGVRRGSAADMVIVELATGRPQRPVHAILRQETVALLFPTDGAPRVMAAREDFPDTPHQGLMPAGLPPLLCVDDRPWADARMTHTGAELLERVVGWFRKAGRGELHDLSQPLDPLFYGELFEVVLPRSAWDGGAQELVGFVPPDTERPKHLIIKATADLPPSASSPRSRISMLAYDLAPQAMSRLRCVPNTLEGLQAEMSRRGLDLVADLSTRLMAWHGAEDNAGGRLLGRLMLLFRIPIVHPVTGSVDVTSVVAFITEQSIGEVGERIGLLLRNGEAGNELMPFVRSLVVVPKLAEVELSAALVHAEFDGEAAAGLSGRVGCDARRIAMVGAGAIGSAVAEGLAREGLFASWTVVDDDVFLPHNCARHTLTSWDVGRVKARALAARLTAVRSGLRATAIDADLLGPDGVEAVRACEAADVILDASASVPVSRRICDLPGGARRVSAFFNPSGTAGVLLAEDVARVSDLRSLEAAYHRQIQIDPTLADHLAPGDMLRYTGACRSLTSRIPTSNVQVLSGLVAGGLRTALDRPAAAVRLWTMDADGGVRVASAPTEMVRHVVGEWVVVVPDSLRSALTQRRLADLPRETGGILLGLIDLEAKRIDVVEALAAPCDSIGRARSFVRGVDGLRGAVDDAMRRSLGQLRYVGEWHSHPDGTPTLPSFVDIQQVAWLAGTMSLDGLPGLMLIVGEHDLRPTLGTFDDD